MNYIKDGVYPIAEAQIRADNQLTSFPIEMLPVHVADFGYQPVKDVPTPAADGKIAVEGAPKKIGGVWTQTWTLVPMTPEQIEASYMGRLERMYDVTAQEHKYDNRFTCVARAGYVGPFQAEGQAFGTWMDGCNAIGYQVMGEVLAGTRPLPTFDELVELLPPMVWPS